MRVEKPANERKCVTHVYAHCVTQVCAPCREGSPLKCLNYAYGSGLIFARTLSIRYTRVTGLKELHGYTSYMLTGDAGRHFLA